MIDPDELNVIGCDLMDVDGRPDLAEEYFTKAATAGLDEAVFNLANCLVAQGRKAEAVPVYRAAIGLGQDESWLNLGIALDDLGDKQGARDAYEHAEAVGDPGGPLGIAFLLREEGLQNEALGAAERSVAQGSQTAEAVVACWKWCATHDPELEADLRRGAALFPSARADLAALLLDTGRPREAHRVL